MDRIRRLLSDPSSSSAAPAELVDKVKALCSLVHEEDLARNMEMGRLGAEWLWAKRRASGQSDKRGLKVITVCNTGSLATSGYGTAIGVITALFEHDHLDTAFYAQTTPYHQGSRLTSLELTTLQIPATMICDTMLGSLMQLEDIDGVIVGAVRVVKNGDTANKVSWSAHQQNGATDELVDIVDRYLPSCCPRSTAQCPFHGRRARHYH